MLLAGQYELSHGARDAAHDACEGFVTERAEGEDWDAGREQGLDLK